VNQARKEFSAKSGATVGGRPGADGGGARATGHAAAAAAEAAAKEEEARHQEEVMLATYSNENDLRRAYGERLDLLKSTLESTDVSIKNVRENLAMMLRQASEAELAGHKVTDERWPRSGNCTGIHQAAAVPGQPARRAGVAELGVRTRARALSRTEEPARHAPGGSGRGAAQRHRRRHPAAADRQTG
jgi:hypothetical protein